jgi:spore maturation protein CgeB
MSLERMGYDVFFFTYYNLLGVLATPMRMVITRSATARTFMKPLFLNRINEKLKEIILKVKPDLLFTVKGEIILPSTLDWIRNELKIKTVLWYPDDPNWFKSLSRHIAPHYDYVFTASKRAINRYRKIGVKNVEFLPFACEPSIHKRINLSPEDKKRYESNISFVGTYYPRRHKILSKLKDFNVQIYGPYWRFFMRGKNIHKSVWGPEMVKVFNASKIVLDIYDPNVLQYQASARTMEVTGSGAFLLTEKAYGIGELFEIGKEIVCYKDERELRELIKYYLDVPEEREEIANKGYKRAHKDHTIDKRVIFILNRIKFE